MSSEEKAPPVRTGLSSARDVRGGNGDGPADRCSNVPSMVFGPRPAGEGALFAALLPPPSPSR